MAPTLVREPFHRGGWVCEEKLDGWPMLAYRETYISSWRTLWRRAWRRDFLSMPLGKATPPSMKWSISGRSWR
jgi:hypothetical protein